MRAGRRLGLLAGVLTPLLLSCGEATERAGEADADPSSSAAQGTVGASQEPDDTTWTVAADRYGPIILGASVASVERDFGGVLEMDDPEEALGSTCRYAADPLGREGVALMISDDRVARVDVRDPLLRTTDGLGVGDRGARVRGAHPDLEARPHEYQEGEYFIVTPDSAAPHRLVFEIVEGVVSRYRAGVLPEVEWVEGCS